jgi:pyridinium-3,5-biscarboxylic acid mononucleotide sulfurtransferase
MNTGEKTRAIKRAIASKGSMLVAFSGGVDSTLLAVLAKDVLGNNTACVLLDSPVMSRTAVEQAHRIAHDLGLRLDTIPLSLMEHEEFRKNPSTRCYICKKISAACLRNRAEELGLASVADGMNISDLGEYRPGLAASSEEGIIHPFIESRIAKHDIREIARKYGLTVWQKPSDACLSSRIPYGEEITREKLQIIEDAEMFLAGLGFGQLRVRLYGTTARIEVHKEDMEKIVDMQSAIVKKLKSAGFSYVTLDLEGYRSGSMDEIL